ncbi:mechanosensitive ion channel family protein [bacterium]|nr:mechanosensitive ion channel family protein [bacterium]
MLAWYLQAPGVDPGSGSGDEAGEAEGAPQDEMVIAQDAAETYGQAAEGLRETAEELAPEPLLEAVRDFGSITVGGVSLLGISLGVLVVLIAVVLRSVLLGIIDRYLKRIVERTETKIDDAILSALRQAVSIFVILGGLFLAFTFVSLPREPVDWQGGVWRILNTLILISLGILAYRAVEIFLAHMVSRRKELDAGMLDKQVAPLLRDVAKVVLIVLVAVAVAQSWGYSAAGLLAGVGIGGLALAFAAKDSVANIFGSFVIYADRPFKVGDWILIGGVEGTVEEIGIRSTRVRKFDKTLVSVPNKKVTTENIQNFSAMPIRRIKVNVGVSYELSLAQMRASVEAIREMLRTHPDIDQRFWMVNFTELGESSLDILVYCFTKTTVWKEYMDIRQEVLLKILELLEQHGVKTALPSRTVYYKNLDAPHDSSLPPELEPGATSDLPEELPKPGAE